MDKKHILIIDDVLVSLKTARCILEEYYKVSLVTSGFQALEFLEKNYPILPDLILMDILMPGIDGIETTRRIKKLYGDGSVPIIYLTSVADKATIIKCYDVGLEDYIIKPFNSADMLKKIENVLKNQ